MRWRVAASVSLKGEVSWLTWPRLCTCVRAGKCRRPYHVLGASLTDGRNCYRTGLRWAALNPIITLPEQRMYNIYIRPYQQHLRSRVSTLCICIRFLLTGNAQVNIIVFYSLAPRCAVINHHSHQWKSCTLLHLHSQHYSCACLSTWWHSKGKSNEGKIWKKLLAVRLN